MKCSNCPQYESNPTCNRCKITDDECFRMVNNCNFVNDDGTINNEEINRVFRIKD